MMKRSLSLQPRCFGVLIVSVSALAAEQVTIVHMTHQWHGDGWHRYVKEVAGRFHARVPAHQSRGHHRRRPRVHRQVPCDDRRRHAARHYAISPRVSATWRWKVVPDLAPYLARKRRTSGKEFAERP